MSAPATIDLAELLAPISDAAPTGTDPRANTAPNSAYYRVKDARTSARAFERTNVDPEAPISDSWQTVIEAGSALLAKEAKDLEIAAWMTEALVRIEGFPGLRDGFKLLTGLAETFWDGLYPMPDEDGMEARVSPVIGLNGAGAPGTLAQPIRTLPIIGVIKPFSLWSYDQMLEADKLTDPSRKAARLAAGTPSVEAFRESLAETAATDIRDTLDAVQEATQALIAMGTVFDAKASDESPPTRALQELLERVAGSIRFFAADKLGTIPAEAPAATAAAGAGATASLSASAPPARNGAAPASFTAAAPGAVASREDALAAVLDLASYFRRTEPQAPISYTLEEAVRRARMSLPDLLKELTLDAANAGRFLLAAGIRQDNPAVAAAAATVPAAAAAAATPAAAPVQPSPKSADGW